MRPDFAPPADRHRAKVPTELLGVSGRILGSVLLGFALPGFGAAPPASDAAPAGSNDAVITEAPAVDSPSVPRRPSSPTPATPGEADAERPHWGLAPIRWGGSLGLGFRRIKSDDNGETREQIYEAAFRADSYIAEPWIAKISLRGTTITGDAVLNVFPSSRFPFQASISASDSRTDGSLVLNDYASRRLSLRQDYRPEQGSWSVFGQYDRSELSGAFGRDTVDRLGGGFTVLASRQTLNVDGSWSVDHRTNEGDSKEGVASARHTFRLNDTLTIESLATYSDSDLDFSGNSNTVSGRTTSWQALSFGSWVPADSPWRATGTVRYFQTDGQFDGSDTKISNAGASGSLTYQANQNLSYFGSMNLNATTSDNQRVVSSSESGGANYSSTPLTFGNYSYNWYGSASLTNVTAPSAGQRTLATTLGHTLQRNWELSPVTSLSGSLGQTVSPVRASGFGALSTTNLVNTANLSLRAMASDSMVGYLGANLSDSRTRGDVENSFRLFNVQLNGTWRLSSQSDINANLTWQKTIQSSGEPNSTLLSSSLQNTQSRDGSVSGSVIYTNSRVFDVRGLQYSLRYTGNTFQTDSRLAGNPDAPRDQVTRDLDQRLNYRIGRLNTQLQMRISEINGKKNALLFLKAVRDFGAY